LVKFENAGHGLPGECAKEINEELFSKFRSILIIKYFLFI
jgi:hypothetical protein